MTTDSPLVVISPHFDDAALSLGGYLSRLDRPKTIVTVHGGPPAGPAGVSSWDAACGFASGAEAYAVRMAEDARSCELLGAEQVALRHPDGPYAPGARLVALEEFLAGLDPAAEVLVPMGTDQRDHQAVRDQALAALAAAGRRLPLVYADLPYSGALAEWGTDGAEAALARAEVHGRAYRDLRAGYGLRPVHNIRLDREEWAVKRAAVLCHGSQLAALAVKHRAFLRYPGPLESELIWEPVPRTTGLPGGRLGDDTAIPAEAGRSTPHPAAGNGSRQG
ncbi:PIG-L deacetylase family protein [Streptomyces orinoci]|uniref:PIG-L family deacetylase n=1 Tax=Streptomyces orinoci TaxID=67339 RepID=A0ABV3K5D2_STRON|nr:PIG-L family deacetylase [Streptomyces orinoci]